MVFIVTGNVAARPLDLVPLVVPGDHPGEENEAVGFCYPSLIELLLPLRRNGLQA